MAGLSVVEYKSAARQESTAAADCGRRGGLWPQ